MISIQKPFTNTLIHNRMVARTSKKNLKKNINRLRMRIGEKNTNENSFYCNGGINKESLKPFENMLNSSGIMETGSSKRLLTMLNLTLVLEMLPST
ncbi:hypothetical protein KSP39_PZI016548 [Platanthera zijinensis]|uniref:Uncharacterized protein n=1 Tax=Platanthera zijinensis TaxID=2320716 RepID=A0AAP0B726_9ASPA